MADDSIVAEYRLNVDATKRALDDIIARLGKVEQETKASADRSAKEQEKAAARAAAAAAKAAKEQEKAANQAARAAEKAAKETENANTKAARQAALEAQKAAQAQAKAAQEAARAQAKAAQEAANAQKKAAQEAAQAQQKNLDQIKGTVTSMAGVFGVAFGVQQIAQFTKETVQLAARAEGVENAFRRIGSPKILAELRNATKGTVSDLELMKNAVRANNFEIPLTRLATLFEFARRRAAETGEDVNFLVDSIILGIGRKSPMILDNLGISATKLRDKFKGISVEAADVGTVTDAVADIAAEGLAEMGEEALTTQIRIDQISATFQNMQRVFGEALISVLNGLEQIATDPSIAEHEKTVLKSAEAYYKISGAISEAYQLTHTLTGKMITDQEELAKSREVISQRESELAKMNSKEFRQAEEMKMFFAEKRLEQAVGLKVFDQLAARENIKNVQAEIDANNIRREALRQEIEAYKAYVSGPKKDAAVLTQSEIRNVAFLTAAIKALKEEQEGQGTSVERVKQITQELIPLQAELDALLGKTSKTTEDQAKKLKELKERLGEVSEMLLKIPDGFRQFAVDANGVGNSINTLNEMLSQAQAQMNAAPLFSDAFKQAEEDVERLKLAIKEAMGEMQIDVSRGYQGITSGIEEESRKQLDIIQKKQSEERQIREDSFAIASTLIGGWLDMVTRANQYELISLENALNAGQITREKYDEERKRLMREQAENQKSAALLNAIVSTAAAVATALTAGPVSGQILAALTAALGAVQIGIIASEPVPQFAKGGWVDGKPHSLGGTKIEAEKGEFIINRKAAAKHAPLIEAINDDRIPEPQQGWDNLMQSIKMQAMFNDRNMIAAIDRHREADTRLLHLIATKLNANGLKRGGYA